MHDANDGVKRSQLRNRDRVPTIPFDETLFHRWTGLASFGSRGDRKRSGRGNAIALP